MKKLIYITILVSCFCFQDLSAQRLSLKSKEIGLNISNLIGQVIPFNNSSRKIGPYSFIYRSGRNNRYFNFELGVQVFSFNNNTERNHFNMAMGMLRKKPFGSRFVFYNSLNFTISAGSFNEPNEPADSDTASIGLSYSPGLEFHVNDYFYIATEAHLFAGVWDDGVRIHVVPPIGIFLMVRLN